jgi:hypothetical protein
VGLKLAQQRGDTAPAYPDGSVPGAEMLVAQQPDEQQRTDGQ